MQFPDNKKAQLFINPAAGRGKGKKYAAKIRNFLHHNGLITNASFSRAPGDIAAKVKQACIDGCETIIVAGGDGSIYEAVNGIMQASQESQGTIKLPARTRLGIIPVGTGNDFIKAAKIPNNWQLACEQLLSATPRLVDVAKLSTKNVEHYFVNNIGSGFDAGIGITASNIPLLRGKAVYVLGLLWHLLKGIPNPQVEIKTENYENTMKTTLVAVSNGICYGGSFKITPQASINDGLIDAVIAPPVGRFGAIPLIIQLMRGTHLNNQKVTHLQCRKLHLKSDSPIPLIADGEIIDKACSEYTVELLERRLSLLA
ncbi:MAG: diacylglycerol kinase family lipid kinase [Gammaproteobacteria bacterium]|nr:diacylglycerol kinase family lipid kinase [Gammaproteobacteria bacterium]